MQAERGIRWDVVAGIVLALAGVVAAAKVTGPAAPTSQPAGEETLLRIMTVELSPGSPTLTTREMRRRLEACDADSDLRKALDEMGHAEVLSRPSVLVRWPQAATINIGERVPTVREGSVEYQEVGLTISVDGEWLRTNPKRAYLRMDIDHSYLQNAGAATTQPASSIVRQKLQKERIVTEGKTAWLIMPVDESKETARRFLISG